MSFSFPAHCLGSFLHINIPHAQSWLSCPSPDWHLMGQQSKIVLFGALPWAEHVVVKRYTPLSVDPFNAPCRGDMVCVRSVRKQSAVPPLLRKMQETLLKVMCQQFHGTGHIWKMRMRKMCYWKFWVCAVRWIPGRRFICRLIVEAISLSVGHSFIFLFLILYYS